MNGVHDMGGMHGFGPVEPEPDEPVFHAEWERRVYALTSATPGTWTGDEDRFVCESLPPAEYLSKSYYDVWLTAFETLLVTHGQVSSAELATGRASRPSPAPQGVLRAEDVPAFVARVRSDERPASAPVRFGPGDRVRARIMNPAGHTRLPRYVRGRPGTIARVHGYHVFPDTNAHGLGEEPHWLYSVAFAAADLWGEAGNPRDEVLVDMWEPYLEAP
jgi:nitrile hydratase beta subunit